MKKILFILIMFLGINNIYAEELIDITDKVELRTKWYKEIKEETYEKKGVPLEGYIEDESKIRYNDNFTWSESNCNLELENQERQVIRTYSALRKVDNIKITNVDALENITILDKDKEINFKVITKDNEIQIKLDTYYNPEDMTILLSEEKEFDIELLYNKYISVYKHVKNEKVLKVDNTWSTSENSFINDVSINEIREGPFRKISHTEIKCALGDIETYRYKISKVYYDDNYYSYIPGYLPDLNNIKVYYKEDLSLQNTCNVEKVTEEPQIITKYIEKKIPQEVITKYIKEECNPEIITEYIEKPQTVEYKYITQNKMPRKIYFIIISLSLIIMIIFIKKCRLK